MAVWTILGKRTLGERIDKWLKNSCEITWEKAHAGAVWGRNKMGDRFVIREKLDYRGGRDITLTVSPHCPEDRLLCNCRDYTIVYHTHRSRQDTARKDIRNRAQRESLRLHGFN